MTQVSDNGIVRDGDVIYVSTDLENSPKTSTTSTTRQTQTAINVPTGFATSFITFLNAILSFVMVISTLLVFFYLIWGAFNWITSGGDKGKVDQARQKIIAAVVGLIIVASSFAIATLVTNFLGFSSYNEVFDNIRTITGGTIDIQ